MHSDTYHASVTSCNVTSEENNVKKSSLHLRFSAKGFSFTRRFLHRNDSHGRDETFILLPWPEEQIILPTKKIWV